MDLDDEHDDYPEQFSEESRAALQSATAALVEGLQRHVQAVLAMRGGTKETPAVFAINEEVERLVDEWNDRVLDHTGTVPLALVTRDDDEEEDEDLVELGDGTPIAVVSRFDLVVTDSAALTEAGRQAHRRLREDEDEEDAAAAVSDVGQALYALLHERGEPWYELPGVEVVRGVRRYVRPDEPAVPLDEDDLEAPIVEPEGEQIYGESWA